MMMNRSLRKMRSKTRAIEPIIASLLLIAIAVAAAVITYSWVTGMVTNQQAQAGTSIRVDNVQFAATTNKTVVLTIRNTGTVSATVATVYINGASVPTTQKVSGVATTSKTVGTGSTMDFIYTVAKPSATWTISTQYTIKIITDNGFSIEATYTSPSTLT